MIEVIDLVKHYRASDGSVVRAVDGVSLSVAPGEMVGLLGANGPRVAHQTGGTPKSIADSCCSKAAQHRRALGAARFDPHVECADVLCHSGLGEVLCH